MDVSPLQRTVSASDIQPERLAHNPALNEQQKIAEASRQFEAILVRQILEQTQKPVIQSKYSDNSTSSSIYRDMVTCQLADSISHSGALGLAKTFEQQLSSKDSTQAAEDSAETPDNANTLNTKPVALSEAEKHRSTLSTTPLRSAQSVNTQTVPLQ